FTDVVADLAAAQIPVQLEWFRPHFEFRFPLYGKISSGNVEVELRQAIEPWYVLGEEGITGGTARYVDSSLERMQVKVNGLTGVCFAVKGHGKTWPLTPTGTSGGAVAGIRYRAWRPPSALHPTTAPHVPLTIDLIDAWSERSVPGCRYHASHPGGRHFE